MNYDNLSDMVALLLPAVVAGILVILTHIPLGFIVLKRGIIFIDLAIAQIAGLGAIVALLVQGEDGSLWAGQAFSITFALMGALGLSMTEALWPKWQEAIIGAVFVFSAALALLLLGHSTHGAEHMQSLLSGQILWVSWPQILQVAGMYVLLLLVWLGLRRRTKTTWSGWFYLFFAVVITGSVQLVGVYLVFASLIFPALTSLLLGWRAISAYVIGFSGLAMGIGLSLYADLATGPTIVCCLFFLFLTLASGQKIAGVIKARCTRAD